MNSICELFKNSPVQYVISIDDCYCNNTVPDTFDVIQHMVQNKDTAISFLSENGNATAAEFLQETTDDEQIRDYLNSVGITSEQKRIYQEKNLNSQSNIEKEALIDFLKELKDDECISEYETIGTLNEAKNYFGKIQDGSLGIDAKEILWLVDYNLENGGGTNNSGEKLISELLAQSSDCGIFALTSNQQGGDINSNELRERISSVIGQDKLFYVCTIPKNLILHKEYNELSKKIAHGLRSYSAADLWGVVLRLFNNANSNTESIVKDFGDDTFYKIFFESGKGEGVSPIEVLQRILMIILGTNINSEIASNYMELAKRAHEFTELCRWCAIDEKDEKDYQTIYSARASECYDALINDKYMPVISGDIFSVNNEYYCVIGQACDATIRENGERKHKCATLAKIIRHAFSERGKISEYELKYFKPNERWVIDFNEVISIDYNILDLCTLNKNGTAMIDPDFNFEVHGYIYISPVRARLREAIGYNEGIIRQYNAAKEKYEKEKQKFEEIINVTRQIYQDNYAGVIFQINNGIKYNIRREIRIKEEYIDDIIRKYASYISRKAMNYDFAENYSIIPYKVNYDVDYAKLGIHPEGLKIQNMDRFIYFDNIFCNDKKKKKRFIQDKINEDFPGWFAENMEIAIPVNMPSITVNNDIREITIAPEWIPVIINNTKRHGIIQKAPSGIKIKLKRSDIEGIKGVPNGTYDMDNGSKMVVSGSDCRFEFPDNVPMVFNKNTALDKNIRLHFETDDGNIILKIELTD